MATQHLDFAGELQRLSGTTLDEAGAANVYAGTTGLETLGALNVKAGTTGAGLNAVCNTIAGTTGLEAAAALSTLSPVTVTLGRIAVNDDPDGNYIQDETGSPIYQEQ